MQPIFHNDPGIQGGVAVFSGNTGSVKTCLIILRPGTRSTIYLASFPAMTRKQAIAALELARETLAPDAQAPR